MNAAAAARNAAALRRRRAFLPVLTALSVLAWLTLWSWERSPYGRYLHHQDWSATGPAVLICQTIPGGGLALTMALYAAAWMLMTAAMMLPTTLPLFDAFDRVTVSRADHARLLTLLGLGYVSVWSGFGLLAHGLHAVILATLASIPTMVRDGWLIGVAVVALAGAFQFSSLKTRCLDKCRSPLSFVSSHWRGHRPHWQAFLLGAHHGAYCVGCCWALMLLMFALGTGSLGWMLLLGAVMAVEKNLPWGRRLSAPLGATLLFWAAAMLVWHP
jgi:predicted metal-binding membrane protein